MAQAVWRYIVRPIAVGGMLVGSAYTLFRMGRNLTSSLGRALLPGALGLRPGVVVLLVVAVALGAFAFTHWLDRKLGNTPAGEPHA